MKRLPAVACFIVLFLPLVLHARVRNEYKVKPGDTTSQIIYMLRMEGIDVKQLHKWNPDLGTQVRIDQVIVYYTPDAPLPPLSREEARAEARSVMEDLLEARQPPEGFFTRNQVLALSGVGLILILGVIVWRTRKGQHTSVSVKQEPIEPVPDFPVWDPFEIMESKIPVAKCATPDIPFVKAFLEADGIDTCIVLVPCKKERLRVPLIAKQTENDLYVITCTKDNNPAVWKKRFEKAEQVIAAGVITG